MRWLVVIVLVVLLVGGVTTPVVADTGSSITVTAAPPILVPIVTASSATSITNDSAVLHGNITDIEGDNASLRGFEWGLSTGSYTWSWNETDDFGTGGFEHQITSLSLDTQYFWRAFAENEAGLSYSSELDFWTTGTAYAPGNFTVTQVGVNSVNITWTMGTAADITVIRSDTEGCPSSPTDGYEVYSGNGTWVLVEGLSLALTSYCFRAWSYNDYGYSEDYAEGSIGGDVVMMIGLIILVLGLTIMAFVLKNAILHMVCVPAWIILGVFLWNQSWPADNTYIPTALLLLAIAVAIVNLVMTVNHYLGQRTAPPTHDEIQGKWRRKIRDITRRDQGWPWP